MYSDNGTNLNAADKELKSLIVQLDREKVKQSIANKGIVWHFSPPLVPHFGGVHESMVKSAKRAINAILANANITNEGLINTRPLAYQSVNTTDDVLQTSNHFLHVQVGGGGGRVSLHQLQWTTHRFTQNKDGTGFKSHNFFKISGTDGYENGYPVSVR